MKNKHLDIRMEQCQLLAKASNCPRRQFGALLLDPERNVVLMDGYNGGPRGGGALCGGDVCLRDAQAIRSGTRMEVGCHHAEMNVICNAAAAGVATRGAWMVVTGEPCLLCAKLIHHAGLRRVLVVDGGYAGENGVAYLQAHGVEVEQVAGPRDPRLAALTALTEESEPEPRNQYDPSEVSHPGETLAEILTDKGWTVHILADKAGVSSDALSAIIDGAAPMTFGIAVALEPVIGADRRFWAKRQAQYTASLPEEERWIWENPEALSSVNRGLAEAERGEIKKFDLSSLPDDLDD